MAKHSDETVQPLDCDCEPTIHGDGSVSHEDECAIYPWCPHEVGGYVCDMPCRCGCRSCAVLTASHLRYSPAGGEDRG